jgi:hypothetical protein
MNPVIQSAQEPEAASGDSSFAPVTTKVRVADLWPPALIVLGIALTVVWAAGLAEVLALLI